MILSGFGDTSLPELPITSRNVNSQLVLAVFNLVHIYHKFFCVL